MLKKCVIVLIVFSHYEQRYFYLTHKNKHLNVMFSVINYLLSPEVIVRGAQTLVPLVALSAGCYLLIVQPQREQYRQKTLIDQQLKPGVTAKTANKQQGIVLFINNNSVILELATGQKIEVLKQTITAITHANT